MKRYNWIVIVSLLLFGAKQAASAQNFGLKILTVDDSSQVDSTLIKFDDIWYQLMSNYGTDSCNPLVYGNQIRSRTHPLVAFNFISGVGVPFNEAFGYYLRSIDKIHDSLYMINLDLGWMQYVVLFNSNTNKIADLSSINYYNWTQLKWMNLTVYHPGYLSVEKKQLKKSLRLVYNAIHDMGLEKDSFANQEIISVSSVNLSDAYRFIGALIPDNYFDYNSIYGGMGDPYNKIILSGVAKPIHEHELLHFAIYLQCCKFLGEGLATYYGGTGVYSYMELKDLVFNNLERNNIRSFTTLWEYNWDFEFNTIRGSYVVCAILLDKIKKDFGLDRFREFIRMGRTNEMFLETLMKFYNEHDEQVLFKRLLLE